MILMKFAEETETELWKQAEHKIKQSEWKPNGEQWKAKTEM